MKSSLKITISVIIGLVLILGGFGLLNGFFSGEKDAHPPCEQLPKKEKAIEALNSHQTLVEEIKALGDGIEVEVGTPCSDDKDRGLVMIIYDSKSERDAISTLLGNREGFGVPIHLVKR
ncbi:hypothetical protein HNQ35_001930 [Cerasibacillus quisquiliarum]|uniref:Uncharacterized protein n=1 Tax=Cerasibacillus quisquiliarum TaxID=227865 RepID=A0A511UY05_9BACI|nr:hypothetical protein [Cerasibacillus quisquiliarum]MBB5146720.1 hypothetical protein [Cerasibacillus quisquiliarum]GEN31519.1 hypothetical protein CQU01_17570 [Cerasibacillus quisquiliarum]